MSKFIDLGLDETIIKGVEALGFETPTPIQQKVIPVLLENDSDVVALAQTGTGKTAAFGLPILHKIQKNTNNTQALILSPTRELGLQIAKDIENFGKFYKKLNVATIYGGASIDKQIRDIKKGPQVIVATPGRLVDMIKRKAVNLSNIEIVVLDEADEMLNMGFKTDLDFILDKTPEEKMTWLFSATMPKEVARIAKNYMTDPLEVTAGEKNTGSKNIEHQYYMVDGRDRYEALKRVVDINPQIFGLVFCQTKRQTQEVADNLMRDGYNADSLHGDLSQFQRDRVMHRFRKRTLQILVATDVAARGIDVDDITHVINYNIPDDIEAYTHRSGRTGRAGKTGVSICIITPSETRKIREIEKIIKSKFTHSKVPDGFDVCEQQMFALIDKIKDVEINEEDIEKFMPKIVEKFDGMEADMIIKKFLSLEFNRFLDYYKDSVDINKNKGDRSSRGRDRDSGGRGRDRDRSRGRDRRGRADSRGDRRDDRGGRRDGRGRKSDSKDGFTLLFANVGSDDGVNPGHLINWVCNNTGVKGHQIGAIRIRDRFSFFEVEDKMIDKVMDAKGLSFEDRKVNIEKAKR